MYSMKGQSEGEGRNKESDGRDSESDSVMCPGGNSREEGRNMRGASGIFDGFH